MPTAAIGAALTGVSALGGILGNRKSARTQESEQTRTGTTMSTESSRRKRVLTGEQEALLGPLYQTVIDRIVNPSGAVEPLKAGARAGLNQAYAGADEALREKFMASGGARSGKMGRSLRELEVGRLGSLAGLENDFARMALDTQTGGLSMAERLLGMMFEEESTGTGTTTENSTMKGTTVMPGSMLAGGINSGLGTLSSILTLNKLLAAGKGG